MRAVVPGYINYKYKDGKILGHTKSAFSDYKILTIHNLIALNALLFIHKIRRFSILLPASINLTISEDSPVIGSTHDTCINWLEIYNSQVYRNSVFFKGSLLYNRAKVNDEFIA